MEGWPGGCAPSDAGPRGPESREARYRCGPSSRSRAVRTRGADAPPESALATPTGRHWQALRVAYPMRRRRTPAANRPHCAPPRFDIVSGGNCPCDYASRHPLSGKLIADEVGGGPRLTAGIGTDYDEPVLVLHGADRSTRTRRGSTRRRAARTSRGDSARKGRSCQGRHEGSLVRDPELVQRSGCRLEGRPPPLALFLEMKHIGRRDLPV